MKLESIISQDAPPCIGPYSHGIRQGNLILTSGQIPVDPKTHEMVREIQAATRTVLNNLIAVVEAGGGSRDTVAKVDVFVRSLDDFAAINQVYCEFFGQHRPARVLVQVADLPDGALLEASMTAFAAE